MLEISTILLLLISSEKYFNKLNVNRLQVNDIKAKNIQSDNIIPTKPEYLFSAVFNGKFERTDFGGMLTFNKNNTDSIIMFSDRPFRQTGTISFDTFVKLFETSGNNSFEEDPPNAVLVHSKEQRTYTVRLSSNQNESVTFNLELLPGEKHDLETVEGKMSFFVDSLMSDAEEIASKITGDFEQEARQARQAMGDTEEILNKARVDFDQGVQITDNLLITINNEF